LMRKIKSGLNCNAVISRGSSAASVLMSVSLD
jgi:hypothetical protein